MDMDMEIDILKGWSAISTINSLRELLVYLSVSLIFYTEKIEAQNNSLFWTNQVELNKYQELTLSYVTSEIGETNLINKAIYQDCRKWT